MSRTTTQQTFYDMRKRCLNPRSSRYEYYGGRGIKIDPRWNKFKNFLEDMGERPKGMTLDRIDVNGNYTKSNCRWTSWLVQQSNRRNNNDTPGVGWHKSSSKWRAYIRFERVHINLGYFIDYDEAVKVRKAAEKQLY